MFDDRHTSAKSSKEVLRTIKRGKEERGMVDKKRKAVKNGGRKRTKIGK